ncbi:MAG: hypothetical protein KIT09_04965 [Bryobacteraceae bacterium]|nr:hypothetical protein [Bryobacteraceae bacterium]
MLPLLRHGTSYQNPSSYGKVREVRLFVILLAATMCANAAEGDEAERRIVRDWRARLAELDRIEAEFRGGLIGGSLSDLGKVGFIFEKAGSLSRQRLHDDDRIFVYAAVQDQPGEEIERNLPSIVNYVRLSSVAPLIAAYAEGRQPWIGAGHGMATLRRVEKAVADFRTGQRARVEKGELYPGRVLTKSNLGPLGEISTYRELRQAFRDREYYYRLQNELTGYGLFVTGLAMLSAATAVMRRRASAAFRVPSVTACSR